MAKNATVTNFTEQSMYSEWLRHNQSILTTLKYFPQYREYKHITVISCKEYRQVGYRDEEGVAHSIESMHSNFAPKYANSDADLIVLINFPDKKTEEVTKELKKHGHNVISIMIEL